MVRDQRTMTGRPRRDLPEIVAAWETYADRARHDHPDWEGEGLKYTRQRLPAYVSDNRWVADCPYCNGGIACWSENPRGACLSCGRVYEIDFPDEREQIENVLDARPIRNRHWRLGEPVEQLKAENRAHGRKP